jgi:hypothetical protein
VLVAIPPRAPAGFRQPQCGVVGSSNQVIPEMGTTTSSVPGP